MCANIIYSRVYVAYNVYFCNSFYVRLLTTRVCLCQYVHIDVYSSFDPLFIINTSFNICYFDISNMCIYSRRNITSHVFVIIIIIIVLVWPAVTLHCNSYDALVSMYIYNTYMYDL